jgi:hypothetical protein
MAFDYAYIFEALDQCVSNILNVLGIQPVSIDRIIAISSVIMTVFIFIKQDGLQKESHRISTYTAKVSKFLISKYYLPYFSFKRLCDSNLNRIESKIDDNIRVAKDDSEKHDSTFVTDKINRNMENIDTIIKSLYEILQIHEEDIVNITRYQQLFNKLNVNSLTMGLGGSKFIDLTNIQQQDFIHKMENFKSDIRNFKKELDNDQSEIDKLRKESDKMQFD